MDRLETQGSGQSAHCRPSSPCPPERPRSSPRASVSDRPAPGSAPELVSQVLGNEGLPASPTSPRKQEAPGRSFHGGPWGRAWSESRPRVSAQPAGQATRNEGVHLVFDVCSAAFSETVPTLPLCPEHHQKCAGDGDFPVPRGTQVKPGPSWGRGDSAGGKPSSDGSWTTWFLG